MCSLYRGHSIRWAAPHRLWLRSQQLLPHFRPPRPAGERLVAAHRPRAYWINANEGGESSLRKVAYGTFDAEYDPEALAQMAEREWEPSHRAKGGPFARSRTAFVWTALWSAFRMGRPRARAWKLVGGSSSFARPRL